jgi:Glyoxalase-like domain
VGYGLPARPRFSTVSAPSNSGGLLAISIVSSAADDHQRHHLDLYASDQNIEVERLLALGATRYDWRYPAAADYIVLADLDGNRFCVIQNS